MVSNRLKFLQNRSWIWIGWSLICIAILLNPVTVGYWLSPDGEIRSVFNQVLIVGLEAGLLGTGMAMLYLHKHPQKLRGLILRLAAIAISCLVILTVLEISFRLFYPQHWPRSEHNQLFRHHPQLGWEFIPEKTGRYVIPPVLNQEITINGDGMRDRNYTTDKPAGHKRIAVLGDSFTSGLEVPVDSVFTTLIERQQTALEVLNFGVNGYGPFQEWLLLQEKVMAYQPDEVWLVLYLRNDLHDLMGLNEWIKNYQRPEPLFHADTSVTLKLDPVPKAEDFHSNRENLNITFEDKTHLNDLHVWHFFKNRLNTFNRPLPPPEIQLFKKEPDSMINQALVSLKKLSGIIQRFCEAQRVEFTLIVAPTHVQVYPDEYWKAIADEYALDTTQYDLYLLNQQLQHYCSKQGISYIDLTKPLLKMATRQHTPQLYGPVHQHWTVAGHQVVAEHLLKYSSSSYY